MEAGASCWCHTILPYLSRLPGALVDRRTELPIAAEDYCVLSTSSPRRELAGSALSRRSTGHGDHPSLANHGASSARRTGQVASDLRALVAGRPPSTTVRIAVPMFRGGEPDGMAKGDLRTTTKTTALAETKRATVVCGCGSSSCSRYARLGNPRTPPSSAGDLEGKRGGCCQSSSPPSPREGSCRTEPQREGKRCAATNELSVRSNAGDPSRSSRPSIHGPGNLTRGNTGQAGESKGSSWIPIGRALDT